MNLPLRAVLSITAVAAGLEFGTRLDERIRLGMPMLSSASSVEDIITIDATGGRGVPGAQYRQFAINSIGLRGPEPTPGRPRILVVGASETFGLTEPSGKEYPRQLQDSLAARGCVVDVFNGGLPGFSLPTASLSYRSRLRALGASVVVLYPTPVQYLEMERPVFRAPRAPRQAPSLVAQVRFVRRLRDHAKGLLPDAALTVLRRREMNVAQGLMAGVTPWAQVPADRLMAYQEDLGAFLDTIRADGTRALVMTHANAFPGNAVPDTTLLVAWAKFYPRAGLHVLPEFDRVANRAAQALSRARGVATLDLAATMDTVTPRDVFADFSHFTVRGSGIVAGALARQLLADFGCPAPRPAVTAGAPRARSVARRQAVASSLH